MLPRVTRTPAFWGAVLVSVVVAPLALVLGIASAGAGHGGYGLAKALFPFAMLSVLINDGVVSNLAIVLGVIKFPIYGVVAGFSIVRERWTPFAALVAIHVITAVACFILLAERS